MYPSRGQSSVCMRNSKNNKNYQVSCIVVKENWLTPLLSCRAVEQMKFITVHYDNFNQVHAVETKNILESCEDIFNEETPGRLPGKVKLVSQEDVKPRPNVMQNQFL